MGIYAAKELIAQARRLAADYRRTVGRPLPGISNEIAEYDAISLLGLQSVDDKSQGYDAIDLGNGERIQIKSRTLFDESKNSSARIGQLKMNQEWDAVMLVLMDEDYQPVEIYQASRADLEEYVSQASASRAKRGALSVARFKIIGELRWTRENGLEDGYWVNQE
ncbi:MAG: hypothetical protein HQL47_00450 [Gammaproteobacteria bacterium]|nr:hypothetical protein [Gammaproteobacteria bacterium]